MEFRIQDEVIRIAPRDASRLLSVLRDRFRARRGFALATLNLDHLVKLRHDSAFLAAYLRPLSAAQRQPCTPPERRFVTVFRGW